MSQIEEDNRSDRSDEEFESLADFEDAVIKESQNQDPNKLEKLLCRLNKHMIEESAQEASVVGIKCILDWIAPTYHPAAIKSALESSAMAGNVDVFRYLLPLNPDPYVGKDVLYFAVEGGVPIWEALLEFNHDIMNWGIGHYGDVLGVALHMGRGDLVAFFLERGIDISQSSFMGMPILPFAKRTKGVTQETIDLLVKYGAKED